MADGPFRIGVDVGGTNTDAVLMTNDFTILGKHKATTSTDIVEAIAEAVTAVVAQSGVDPSEITQVMLGTTHATNAVLERRDLGTVATLRIGGPATKSVPPLVTWPSELRNVVSAGEVIVDGGFEFDGTEQVGFDADGVHTFLDSLDGAPDAFAVASVFAPVSDAHELLASDIIRERFPDTPISLSGPIGSIGLIERENACVLNAALIEVAHKIVAGLSSALERQGIDAIQYFAQNDGTLMALDRVLQFPVLTIGSGPANSMRGAAHLSGLGEAIVVDVGGTSTDIGVLAAGFPRESAIPVEIGGVRTNFRMPDLLALALGGGTVLSGLDGTDEELQVGPSSVGHRLSTEAMSFGGDTPTLSDAAIANGRASFGTHAPDALSADVATRALARIDAMFEDGIDRMKLSRSDQPVIAVGGGSVLMPEALAGASEIVRPEHHDVANAVGAAIAAISAEIDQIFSLDGTTREATIESAKAEAIGAAVALGAVPEATEVVSLEELTMAYMTDNILRLRIKAAGPLQ